MGKTVLFSVAFCCALFTFTPAWAGEKKNGGKDDHKVMHGVRDGGNKASAGIGNLLKPVIKPLNEKRKKLKK